MTTESLTKYIDEVPTVTKLRAIGIELDKGYSQGHHLQMLPEDFWGRNAEGASPIAMRRVIRHCHWAEVSISYVRIF